MKALLSSLMLVGTIFASTTPALADSITATDTIVVPDDATAPMPHIGAPTQKEVFPTHVFSKKFHIVRIEYDPNTNIYYGDTETDDYGLYWSLALYKDKYSKTVMDDLQSYIVNLPVTVTYDDHYTGYEDDWDIVTWNFAFIQ